MTPRPWSVFPNRKQSARLWCLMVGLAFTFATPVRAEDGEALAWKYHCITCHGERGVSKTPQYPMLAGQNATYLMTRLRYFRAQEEVGNAMNGQAAPLSDDEIEALARYFSGEG